MKAKVYFSREITPEKVVALYRAVGRELPGKVAVKLHSGEQGNQNFLGPDFWRPMIEAVHGTVVECNTAYEGERNTTEKHRRTMIKHGWSTNFDVDILDAEGPDLELAVPNGRSIQKNFVGKDIANYDSMLVLSHFKGHPMGGFGGAQAALHRLRVLLRQGLYPRCRRARKDLDCRPRQLPRRDGGRRLVRGGIFQGQDRFHQRYEEYVRGLRLLRRG